MFFQNFFDRIFYRGKLSLKHVFALFSFIFVIWTFYRYFPEILPAWVEELVLKPIIWLGPTLWLVKKIEKEDLSSLGFTKKNLRLAFYWGGGLGVVFALEGLLTNIFKYQGLNLSSFGFTPRSFLAALAISFATALSEETVFRGYIFSRLLRLWKSEWRANLISALLFTVIYLPVSVFVLGYQPLVMFGYLTFIFIYGFASAFIFARSENLMASILLHVFWSWPIFLFR